MALYLLSYEDSIDSTAYQWKVAPCSSSTGAEKYLSSVFIAYGKGSVGKAYTMMNDQSLLNESKICMDQFGSQKFPLNLDQATRNKQALFKELFKKFSILAYKKSSVGKFT